VRFGIYSHLRARFINPNDICGLLEEDSDSDYQIDDQDDIDFEPEAVEEDDHNSESEEEMYDSMDDDIDEDIHDMEGLSFYIGRNNDTIWANKQLSKTSKVRSKNIIKTIHGPKAQARVCKTRLDCFLQIFSLEIIDDIVKLTNIFIAQKKYEKTESSDTPVRDRDYKSTSRSEIKAVFGALFLISVKRGNRADINEFFNKNGTGLTILRANFSERRFRLLLRSLRFDDITTRQERSISDKLAPIRNFHSTFVANCQSAYNVGESVTIDEMLVSFRGRCSFIQYMPQKPAKYGIKMYSMCDSQTFYTFNMIIYCGTQKPGPYETSNKPFDIVKTLTELLKRTNRNVTTDNWFSSYPLAEYLSSVGLTFLGTLRKNKSEIPAIFVTENKNLVPGSYLFGYNDTPTLVSYVTKKKKIVLVLSTLHDKNEADDETGMPVQVMDYNATKGGVDTVDLMCSRISTSRRTKRWPMIIFFRYLDIAGINSMRIYQINNCLETFGRRKYIFNLAIELMDENLRERAKICSLPKDLSVFLNTYRNVDNKKTSEEISNKRCFCYICGSKKNNITRLKCITCDRSICQKHSSHTCDNCQNDEIVDSDEDYI